MPTRTNRRLFLMGAAASAGSFAVSPLVRAQSGGPRREADSEAAFFEPAAPASDLPRDYRGPNVVIIRFGGGVRRRETIDPAQTYSPYFLHNLVPRGTFFPKLEIASIEGVETGHGEGTLNILTGRYDRYKDVDERFLGGRFEAKVPTVFEYFRKEYGVPEHQTLIINGEDRIDEEFYTFSNHHLYGVGFRSNVLSLYRFKLHLLRRQIADGKFKDKELQKQTEKLAKMENLDRRVTERAAHSAEIDAFWERWRAHYGESGFVNPRGDRLLTELTLRAMRELRPRLVMVNYQDPDYVHWGNMTHYTRGIQTIDEGMQRIIEAAEGDEAYRGNTVFFIIPDCGRDNSRLAAVPCQHHFNSRSSREIFALVLGPGIARGAVVDKTVDQINIAATIGGVMGFNASLADGTALEEIFA